MKTSSHLALVRTSLFITSLSIWLLAAANAEARDESLLSPGPVRPGSLLHDRPAPAQGFLKIYSATDKVNDGDVWYFPHSPYAVYAIDGKLVRKVENHNSSSDEIPQVVTLPAGSYVVEARSEQDGGYIRVHVQIKPAQRTTLDLDLPDKQSPKRIAHN
jgi:hypothetical protein